LPPGGGGGGGGGLGPLEDLPQPASAARVRVRRVLRILPLRIGVGDGPECIAQDRGESRHRWPRSAAGTIQPPEAGPRGPEADALIVRIKTESSEWADQAGAKGPRGPAFRREPALPPRPPDRSASPPA